MKRVLKLALLIAVGVWVWRFLSWQRGPYERAGVSFADGSSLVLEPGSQAFARLADAARSALGT